MVAIQTLTLKTFKIVQLKKSEDTQDELEEDDNDDLTDGEDDLIVEDIYYDFNAGGVHTMNSFHKNDNSANDDKTTTLNNLV